MSLKDAEICLKRVFDSGKGHSDALGTEVVDKDLVNRLKDANPGLEFDDVELRQALKNKLDQKGVVPLVRFSFSESPRR